MTFTRSRTTEPFKDGKGGSTHTWQISDGTRGLALAVADWTNNGTTMRILGGITTHEPAQHGDCPIHDRCNIDALVGDLAQPAWRRIEAAGSTDEAVYAELETLHARVFAAVAS